MKPTAAGAISYLALLVVGVGIVLAVLQIGQQWNLSAEDAQLASTQLGSNQLGSTQSANAQPTHAHGQVNVVLHAFSTLAVVILLGAAAGRVFQYLGQPAVIGEILAGLALGPSLLGAISPDVMHWLIPSRADDPSGSVAIALKIIAQLGVVLYMFLVGLELNAAHVKHKAHSAVAISHASIVVPFALGALLSLWLYPMLSDRSVPFVSFALFLGVAMSITAFPVLARILTDRNLQSTPVGMIALSCAAADDVTAWCLLSLVVGVAKAEVGTAGVVILGAIGFMLFMYCVARPVLRRYAEFTDRREGGLPAYAIATVYVLILAASATTEWIGIHAIFGAFLLGAVIPSESELAKSFLSKLKEPVTILLLPAFFAYTGMRTEIGLLNDLNQWLICLAIIGVATLGKFGGTLLALGTLANRGAMQASSAC